LFILFYFIYSFIFFSFLPISFGEDRVAEALKNTSEFLDSISTQALQGINEVLNLIFKQFFNFDFFKKNNKIKGKRLSDIVAGIQIPPRFKHISYLQPVYDDPSFIAHNIWRHYAGWW